MITDKQLDILETIARIMYTEFGKQYSVSSGIDESITYGYGALDNNGFWQFPLYL